MRLGRDARIALSVDLREGSCRVDQKVTLSTEGEGGDRYEGCMISVFLWMDRTV